MRRVVFVLEYYYPHIGGGELLFQHLATGLAAQGIEVSVVTCLLPGTARRETIDGVHIHRVRVPQRGRRHWFSLLALPSVLRLARRPGTIIHSTTHNGAFPAWLGANLCRVPSVMTVYEVFGPAWSSLAGLGRRSAMLYRAFERLAMSLPFDRHICISRYTLDRLATYYPSARRTPALVYVGVDHALFDPGRADRNAIRRRLGIDDRFVVLYFGRPGYSKGLDHLIGALPTLSERVPNLLLLLLLTPEPRNLYDQAVCRLKEWVRHGAAKMMAPVARRELPSYLAAADCVVIPSLSEGFGLAAAEACAMGRPLVTTTGGALPEVVSGTCILVPPGNPAAIADGVRRVWEGTAPTLPERRFTWERTVEETRRLYETLWPRAG